jgi:hypothetical protein
LIPEKKEVKGGTFETTIAKGGTHENVPPFSTNHRKQCPTFCLIFPAKTILKSVYDIPSIFALPF